MKSPGRTGRVIRTGLVAVVVVLAFAAGWALRDTDREIAAQPAKGATVLDGDRAFRPIRLIQADPGALRRRPRPSATATPAAPAAAAQTVVVPVPAPAPAPLGPDPAPQVTAPPAPDDFESGEPEPTGSFDLEG